MDIFNVLTFIGGISLFLFGMNVMGKALEKRAGGKLKTIINKMTTNKFIGFLTGLGVTAIIQSSSATTVMVVGFVNSGMMNLSQSINVIMGANVGTTVTSWLLSLSGISSGNIFIKLLKPSSFSPILALIGIILHMFSKKDKTKDTGLILLGFATLMFGMETMSSSVSGLKDVEWFKNMFIAFNNNPLLGILVGAFVTAVIQSSSASVGILQAFATTGQISYGSAIPIILGQNIGTCVTALISSVGTNKNAKRASLVHLFFNLIGTILFLAIYLVVRYAWNPIILSSSSSLLGIAVFHTIFNIFSVVVMFPMSRLLEKLVCLIIPLNEDVKAVMFDDRLLETPSIALEQAKNKINEMVEITSNALEKSIAGLNGEMDSNSIKDCESKTDILEDAIGSYLVKISSKEIDESLSRTAGGYLKVISDVERIGDHCLNMVGIKDEINEKGINFSEGAKQELDKISKAVLKVWSMAEESLLTNDVALAKKVEPLEQVIDKLNRNIRDKHILRLQKEECKFDVGFIWSDILSNFERISDHCSNIAGVVIDEHKHNMNMHYNINEWVRDGVEYDMLYEKFAKEYGVEEA